MEEKYFMTRVRHRKQAQDSETMIYEKGCEVHDTLNAALVAFHAYLAAYAYEHDETMGTDYVMVMIHDMSGLCHKWEIDDRRPRPAPTPTPTPTPDPETETT